MITKALSDPIRKKLKTMTQYLNELKQNLPKSSEEYLKAGVVMHGFTERGCQVAIECAIDANNLLIGLTGGVTPESARESFRGVSELGAIDNEVVSAFRYKFVPFRNRIVHVYEDLDNRIVYESAQSLIDSGGKYIQQMTAYLEQSA
ncbi:MAG: DUF86 domain-containing protein [Candidatus Poribacteria bacterium]|nr:DUF86 domain-containing protein [Candidatus Poribacteria bacterium]